MSDAIEVLVDFCGLLLFPLLGVLALLRKRALPWLAALATIWLVGGAACLTFGWTFGLARAHAERAWWVGLALAGAFLAVAWLKDQRGIARGLKLTMAAIALIVFAQALLEFLRRYG